MIFDKIKEDSNNALKEHNKIKRETLTSLIAAIKKVGIDEKIVDYTDDFVNKIIIKERKTLAEQVENCPASREDLLNEYKTRLSYIDEYMPKLMSYTEVVEFVENNLPYEIIGSKNLGMAMKTIMPMLKGKADGKDINNAVKEVLK